MSIRLPKSCFRHRRPLHSRSAHPRKSENTPFLHSFRSRFGTHSHYSREQNELRNRTSRRLFHHFGGWQFDNRVFSCTCLQPSEHRPRIIGTRRGFHSLCRAQKFCRDSWYTHWPEGSVQSHTEYTQTWIHTTDTYHQSATDSQHK